MNFNHRRRKGDDGLTIFVSSSVISTFKKSSLENFNATLRVQLQFQGFAGREFDAGVGMVEVLYRTTMLPQDASEQIRKSIVWFLIHISEDL